MPQTKRTFPPYITEQEIIEAVSSKREASGFSIKTDGPRGRVVALKFYLNNKENISFVLEAHLASDLLSYLEKVFYGKSNLTHSVVVTKAAVSDRGGSVYSETP